MAEEGGKRRNKWLTHVKKTMKAHKGMKFGQVLKMAKKTYKGGAEGGEVQGSPSMHGGPLSGASPVGGRRRKTRRGRKGGMGHMNGMNGSGYGMY